MEFVKDILVIILNDLTLFEIIRFRRVNKTWKQIIDSTYDNKEVNIYLSDGFELVVKSKYLEIYHDTHLDYLIDNDAWSVSVYPTEEQDFSSSNKAISEIEKLVNHLNSRSPESHVFSYEYENTDSLEGVISHTSDYTFDKNRLLFHTDNHPIGILKYKNNEISLLKALVKLIEISKSRIEQIRNSI